MIAIYETAKQDLGYNASRFLQMISERGGLQTAKHLISTDQPSDGFTTLWQRKRLDLTVEAHVLAPDSKRYSPSPSATLARQRLREYGWSSPAT
jgi:hypothetical protein